MESLESRFGRQADYEVDLYEALMRSIGVLTSIRNFAKNINLIRLLLYVIKMLFFYSISLCCIIKLKKIFLDMFLPSASCLV